MKKLLKPLLLATVAVSAMSSVSAQTTTPEKVQQAIGPTTAPATTVNGSVTVQSPRTGISYTFPNPNQRPVVLQTAAIAPANAANANRIVADNPALSAESQQKAKAALLSQATQLAKN